MCYVFEMQFHIEDKQLPLYILLQSPKITFLAFVLLVAACGFDPLVSVRNAFSPKPAKEFFWDICRIRLALFCGMMKARPGSRLLLTQDSMKVLMIYLLIRCLPIASKFFVEMVQKSLLMITNFLPLTLNSLSILFLRKKM